MVAGVLQGVVASGGTPGARGRWPTDRVRRRVVTLLAVTLIGSAAVGAPMTASSGATERVSVTTDAALPSASAQDLAERHPPSAAQPDDGAVVLGHPRKAVFWTGGPVSGVALPEMCTAGGCHEVALAVTVPPGGVAGLQVGIRWADESRDLGRARRLLPHRVGVRPRRHGRGGQ